IAHMARYLDLMLCIFPFEAELYNASGLRTIFVGHPMIENLAKRRTGGMRDPDLIGLFPGSRSREVKKILPVLLETAREIVPRREQMIADFDTIIARLGETGASEKAARAILSELNQRTDADRIH